MCWPCVGSMTWTRSTLFRSSSRKQVIGRSKRDSVELAGAELPATAHISRVQIDDGSGELQIYRRSVPYGTVAEHGLYFVAFSADRARYDLMLARMFGTSDDGGHDHLLEFSHPVSGAYYFAPYLAVLTELAGPDERL
jgi:porphyrinogen peroxidase